ncbi:MAG: macrolide glycosyltransferase [Herbinix sp.]|jgi:MGT family glycosyltransferase|nr:macrolide glycosyltransferase [Herbinix sp.]
MSKVLFVNGNLHGHINPTLPVVKELVSLGEEVYYFSTEEFKDKILETGATYMDYGPEYTHFLHTYKSNGTHPFYTLIEFMLAMDRRIIPIVLEQTKSMKFDYMIHDVMFGGGTVLSRLLHLPAIASCSSFAMDRLPIPQAMLEPGFHPQLDLFYTNFSAAKSEWKQENMELSDLFFKKEPLTLVFTSKAFQPNGDHFDSAYQFVGPSIADRKESLPFELDPKRTHLYISMGTIVNQSVPFYRTCFEAFGSEDYQVIMSVGKKTDLSALGSIPDNFIVQNYIPQLEVLKHAEVFISHGGLNSVSEALYYGVPILAIPLANDQPMVTKQLTCLGCGIELMPKEVTTDLLREYVRQLLSCENFRQRCNDIRKSFISSGGYKEAARLILNYVKQNYVI